ncbi:unnamed protein product [Albugo candida]|uniref:Uncharacterized protein n=1 Tax=Albugo candida TaxID=65357 RepID=A0A024GH74_9STRA|nr:unnamed protein product [Albugo candida]|eukprot:CCI46114.1 unnamed protein product [Albugo candida]
MLESDSRVNSEQLLSGGTRRSLLPRNTNPTSTSTSKAESTVLREKEFLKRKRNFREKSRSTKSKCTPGLRSGKWTNEEEAYTVRIIHYFKLGLLDIQEGTSLRWYLAKKLNCEAMRVTKKLKGNSSIGKQIYRGSAVTKEKKIEMQRASEELANLKKLFLTSLVINSKRNSPNDGKGGDLSGEYHYDESIDDLMYEEGSPEYSHGISPKKSAMVSQNSASEVAKKALSETENIQADAGLLLYFCIKARHSLVISTGMTRKRLFADCTSGKKASRDEIGERSFQVK